MLHVAHGRDSCCLLMLLLAFTLGVALPGAVRGQAAETAEDRELRYVDGLNDLGLTDYAEIILAKLGSGPEVKARQLDSSLRRGEFAKVQAIIAAEPDQQGANAWAMRLSLADGYFAWAKYPEARKIYDEFFARYPSGPPAELAKFFSETAYKYAQMLVLMGDQNAAVKAFRLGLTGTTDRDTKRQFQGDLADLLMKMADSSQGPERDGLLTEINKIADELLWVQDLWFGRAIVLKAHVSMLRGDVDTAMKLVDEYRDQLVQIDEVLKEQGGPDGELMRLSPMAQARYLLGTILLDEARKALAAGDRKQAWEMLAGKDVVTGQSARKLPGALSHFMNVFVRYPGSKWAADAGAKAEEARQMLERDLGKQVKMNIEPAQWLQVEQEQIKSAKSALNQQQFEEAAEQYQAIINRFPSSVNSVTVLADLTTCYLELGNDLYVDTLIAYLAERYNRNRNLGTTAGNYVLSFANQYGTRNRPERKDAVYEIYFKHFTQHPLAARLLYGFGDRRLKEQDVPGALGYYERVVREHSRSPVSFLALSKMAVCYEQLGDSTNQIKMLLVYIDRAEKTKRLNHELIRVLYRLGTAYRNLGTAHYGAAIKRFDEVETRLAAATRDTYQASPEEAARNQTLLESSLFLRASCYGRVPAKTPEAETRLKEAAIKAFEALVAAYPKSKMAPSALSQAGTLWTVLGNATEAQRVFSQLKTQYPESVEASNVDFMLGSSLLELGKRAEAVEVFKKMFAGGGQYSDGQILSAGNELMKAKEYEIAIQAFDRLLEGAKADQRAKIEPALAGRGRALVALARYAEGVETLERLFKEFPRSSFTVEGQYALSRAYSELALVEADGTKRLERFNKAVEALKAVNRYDTSVERRGDVSLETGRIYELKAQAEAQHGDAGKAAAYWKDAIASYQTLILFEDASEATMRPILEEAYHRCLRLFLERELWQDLAGDSDKYLQQFPSGKHVLDVRQWRSRANARLAGEGVMAVTPAPATP